MAVLPRNLLKTFFERGDRPSQSQFSSLIDSMLHSTEDANRLGLRTYNPNNAYLIGDCTVFSGSLFQAIANTSGPFNPSHWQKVLSLGSVSYQGTWNAQTNSPALASGVGTKGDYYVVSTGGSTALDGIDTWTAADWAVFNGTKWEKVNNADQDDQSAAEVIYDNTSSGLIATDVQAAIDELEGRIETTETDIANITTTDVAEGTNLYYTETRFDASFLNKDSDDLIEGSVHLFMTSAERTKLSGIEAGATADQLASEVPYSNATSGLTATDVQAAIDEVEARLDTTENDLNTITTTEVPEGTNLYYTEARFDTRLATKTSDNLNEGTANLYFTNARFDTRFNTKTTDQLTEGATNKYYTDARFDTRLGTKTTDNLGEGINNLYYTNARFDTRLGTKTTTDLAEGNNLYYTDTRFDTRLGTKTTDNLGEGINNLYYTNARFDTRLGTKTTTDLAEGNNLYYTDARVSANTDVAANTAARHTHSNKPVLDAITNAGSGAIITTAERNKLAGIEEGATADQVASEVPVTPAGNISSTNVQAALQELDTEKEPANANIQAHIASTSNPHNVTKAQVGLGNVENLKVNLTAATNPGAGNDASQGYAAGSRWLNTITDREFVCLDAATGAALWKETTPLFGNDHVMAEAASRTTTILPLFQVKLSVNTGERSGLYRLAWHCVVDNERRSGEFRLINTTDNAVIGTTQAFEAKSSSDRIPLGGISTISLNGTAKTLEIQFRAVTVGNIQGIQDARIELFRIS
jgi:chaperonin cofactor prefoldin